MPARDLCTKLLAGLLRRGDSTICRRKEEPAEDHEYQTRKKYREAQGSLESLHEYRAARGYYLLRQTTVPQQRHRLSELVAMVQGLKDQHTPNDPLRYPIYHLIEAIRPLIEVHFGGSREGPIDSEKMEPSRSTSSWLYDYMKQLCHAEKGLRPVPKRA